MPYDHIFGGRITEHSLDMTFCPFKIKNKFIATKNALDLKYGSTHGRKRKHVRA
jgi:hypothetical protein